MEQIKDRIQQLSLEEQLALAEWLRQLIQVRMEVQNAEEIPNWMWEKAEKAYERFDRSGEAGFTWEEVKKGNLD